MKWKSTSESTSVWVWSGCECECASVRVRVGAKSCLHWYLVFLYCKCCQLPKYGNRDQYTNTGSKKFYKLYLCTRKCNHASMIQKCTNARTQRPSILQSPQGTRNFTCTQTRSVKEALKRNDQLVKMATKHNLAHRHLQITCSDWLPNKKSLDDIVRFNNCSTENVPSAKKNVQCKSGGWKRRWRAITNNLQMKFFSPQNPTTNQLQLKYNIYCIHSYSELIRGAGAMRVIRVIVSDDSVCHEQYFSRVLFAKWIQESKHLQNKTKFFIKVTGLVSMFLSL